MESFGYIFSRRNMGLINFNHCDIISLKYPDFSKTQYNGHCTVQGHSSAPLVLTETQYANSCVWIIVTYVLSCTVSEIRPIIGSIFESTGVPLFNTLGGMNPYIRNGEIWPQETRNVFIVWCSAYFDILNYLSVTHECNRWTNGQTRFITLCGQKVHVKMLSLFLSSETVCNLCVQVGNVYWYLCGICSAL